MTYHIRYIIDPTNSHTNKIRRPYFYDIDIKSVFLIDEWNKQSILCLSYQTTTNQ